MNILVVDDDDILRLTVRVALEERGYNVDEAIDGVQALEKLHEKSNFCTSCNLCVYHFVKKTLFKVFLYYLYHNAPNIFVYLFVVVL